jgi:phosphoribosylaminoimidazole (AIR) synthetase
MVCVVGPDRVDELEASLSGAGEVSYRIGEIVDGNKEVRYA